jgi:phage/plasmid-associated DNA primase
LIGGNPHKKLLIFKGETNTGKSVMIKMINAVLGEYAKTTNRSLFTYHKLNPVLAQALPRRVVSIVEIGSDNRNPLTVDQMKTGTGNDFIEVELKGSNVIVNRLPHFLPIMVTNTVPHIEGHDLALHERMKVITFKVIEEHPDDTIAARMYSESRTAALNWLVEGYKLYCQNGRVFPDNAEMNAATDEFSAQMDVVSRFIDENYLKHESYRSSAITWRELPQWCVSRSEVNSRYEQWCLDNEVRGKEKLSKIALCDRIRELGITGTNGSKTQSIKGRSDRWWFGLKPKKQTEVITQAAWQNPGQNQGEIS